MRVYDRQRLCFRHLVSPGRVSCDHRQNHHATPWFSQCFRTIITYGALVCFSELCGACVRRKCTIAWTSLFSRTVSIACLPIPSRSLPPPSAAQPLPHCSSSSRLRQTIVQLPGLRRTLRFTRKTPGLLFSSFLVYDAGKVFFVASSLLLLLSILPMTHIPMPWAIHHWEDMGQED